MRSLLINFSFYSVILQCMPNPFTWYVHFRNFITFLSSSLPKLLLYQCHECTLQVCPVYVTEKHSPHWMQKIHSFPTKMSFLPAFSRSHIIALILPVSKNVPMFAGLFSICLTTWHLPSILDSSLTSTYSSLISTSFIACTILLRRFKNVPWHASTWALYPWKSCKIKLFGLLTAPDFYDVAKGIQFQCKMSRFAMSSKYYFHELYSYSFSHSISPSSSTQLLLCLNLQSVLVESLGISYLQRP